jgi:glycerol uptake facilitator protein
MISLGRKFLAELLGTFLLVFFGAGAVIITLMIVHGTITPNNFAIGISMGDWLGINVVFGLAIAIGIYAFGKVSGGHFNPAITIALWAVSKFPGRDVLPYIIAQLIGATIASLLFALCIGQVAVSLKLGATVPFYSVGYINAIIVEAVGTFLLMTAVMAVLDNKASPVVGAFVIGLSVTASLTLISNITGGSINPARTFGPYLANTLLGGANLWYYFPIYIIGPIGGALIAAFVYNYISGGTNQTE